MSKSSFYHRFDSKLALFDRIVDEVASDMLAELQVPDAANLAGPGFWKQMDAFLDRVIVVCSSSSWYRDMGRLFYLPDMSARHSRAMRDVGDAVSSWVESVLNAGRSCGAVSDDLPVRLQTELVLNVLQVVDRWSLHRMEAMADRDRRAAMGSQLVVFRRLLEARSSESFQRS